MGPKDNSPKPHTVNDRHALAAMFFLATGEQELSDEGKKELKTWKTRRDEEKQKPETNPLTLR